MLTREEALRACLRLPGAYEDYPFDDLNWTAVRHGSNHKIFALIFSRDGRIWINLKAEPLKADFLRDAFSAVLPGYHMNKRHWISVILDGSMEDGDICALIGDSYRLTGTKTRNRRIQ